MTYFTHLHILRRAVNEGIDFEGQGWAVGTESNKAKNCFAACTQLNRSQL